MSGAGMWATIQAWYADETQSRELGVFLEQVLKDKKSHTLDIQDRDIPLFYERVLRKSFPTRSLRFAM